MSYEKECKEAAERVFHRIHEHLKSLDEIMYGYCEDNEIYQEYNKLTSALTTGDPLEIESHLYDFDYESNQEENE